jgi:hypothetical protein
MSDANPGIKNVYIHSSFDLIMALKTCCEKTCLC